jgi:hypothetical protein
MPDIILEPKAAGGAIDPSRILAQILDRAETLVASGDYRGAIDYATEANRGIRAAELERRLVSWRADAFATMDRSPGRSPWPARYSDPFPGLRGVPEIDAAELTVDMLGGAFQHHGMLLVRDLIAGTDAARLRTGIDRALRARDAYNSGMPVEETSPWYAETPLDTPTGSMRGWGGSLWTADSPRMMYDLLDLYRRHGLIDVMTEYLAEPLTLSIGKSTLRLMEPKGVHDWHQDGAFLGADVRTVNVWLALSDCGVDAPGLDVVAERLPGVVETGSHGANFHWSVGHGLVEELRQGGAEVASPIFRPGDALLFNHLMLHRTGVRPEMTKNRWAIESWFFTPSTFPMDQGPLMV